MPTPIDEWKRITHHEAGHAFEAAVLNVEMTVDMSPAYPGAYASVTHQYGANSHPGDVVRCCLAGAIAEMAYIKTSGEDPDCEKLLARATTDFTVGCKYLKMKTVMDNHGRPVDFSVDRDAARHFWIDCARRTAELIKKHWGHMGQIAEGLNERRFYNCEDIRKLATTGPFSIIQSDTPTQTEVEKFAALAFDRFY
jgi:hypothetical protein